MRIGRFIKQRCREVGFLLLSIPISSALFTIVLIGMDSQVFLPLAVLIFLGLLAAMEWVAKFEVRRTNWMLGTDFMVVEGWFGHSFFSWAGVKERTTSLRSWMAVGYCIFAFGTSVVTVLCLLLMGASTLIILVALGVLPNFGQWVVNELPTVRIGSIDLAIRDLKQASVDWLSWNLSDSKSLHLALGVAITVLLAAMITLPRLARGLAEIVEDLLSGTRLPELEQGIKRLQRESRISERQVREAFDQEPVRGQLADLSRREREILSLMAQGKSNAGIAKALYITEGSVEKHISSILSKLGLRPEADGHRRVLAVLAYLGIHHSPTSS